MYVCTEGLIQDFHLLYRKIFHEDLILLIRPFAFIITLHVLYYEFLDI